MREAAATGSSSVTEMERVRGAGGGRRAEQQRGGRGDPTGWGRRRPRWDPLAVGMGKAPRAPENAALPPFSCKTQNLLRLLLEPLQCAPDLHFADADAFTATVGDSLTVVWLAAIVWYQEKLTCPIGCQISRFLPFPWHSHHSSLAHPTTDQTLDPLPTPIVGGQNGSAAANTAVGRARRGDPPPSPAVRPRDPRARRRRSEAVVPPRRRRRLPLQVSRPPPRSPHARLLLRPQGQRRLLHQLRPRVLLPTQCPGRRAP
jgi:hypothetical protein